VPSFNQPNRWNVTFNLRLQDDITAPSKNVIGTFANLRKHAHMVGLSLEQFNKRQNALNINLKQARKIFKENASNITAFRQSLVAAGVPLHDINLLTHRLTQEFTKNRRAALGLDGVIRRVFSSRTVQSIKLVGYALQNIHRISTTIRNVMSPLTWLFGKMVQGAGGAVNLAVEVARRRQTTMNSLAFGFEHEQGIPKAIAEKKAKDVFEWGIRAARETPLSTEEVSHMVKMLGAYKFGPDEIPGLASIAADIEARLGEGKGEQVIDTFGTIRRRGYAQLQDIRQLTAAGLPTDEVFKILGDRLGYTGDHLDVVNKVRKFMKGGANMDANVFLNAVVGAQTKVGGGIPGTYSQTNAGTLAGVISNFQSIWEDLFSMGEIDKWPGIESLKNFLKMVTQELLYGSGGGILGSLQSAIGSLLGGLDKIKASDVARWVKRIGDMLAWVANKFEYVWTLLDRFLHAGESYSIAGALADTFIEIGGFLAQGFKAILSNPFSAPSDVIKELIRTRHEKTYMDEYGAQEHWVASLARKNGVSKEYVEQGIQTRMNQLRSMGLLSDDPSENWKKMQYRWGYGFFNAGQNGGGEGPLAGPGGGPGGWDEGQAMRQWMFGGAGAPDSGTEAARINGKNIQGASGGNGMSAKVDVQVTVPLQTVPGDNAQQYGKEMAAALAPDLGVALTQYFERSR